MADNFKQIETPQWMLELFKSIDELDTSEDSGFRIFDDNVALLENALRIRRRQP